MKSFNGLSKLLKTIDGRYYVSHKGFSTWANYFDVAMDEWTLKMFENDIEYLNNHVVNVQIEPIGASWIPKLRSRV